MLVPAPSRRRFAKIGLLSVLLLVCAAATRLWAQSSADEAAATARAKLTQLQSGMLADSAATITFSEMEVRIGRAHV